MERMKNNVHQLFALLAGILFVVALAGIWIWDDALYISVL